MQRPKFSIILPIYNVEKYLAQCLSSILNQTVEDFELLCINDASTDSSMDIVNRYAEFDTRIKIINHPENKGLGAARNTALQYATGEFLCCIDSDDWVEENFLEVFLKGFEKTDAPSVWISPWKYYEKNDFATLNLSHPCMAHHPGGELIITPRNIFSYPAYAWNKSYKLDYVKEHGFKWAEGLYFEDMYFYFDFILSDPKAYIMPEMTYIYRYREISISSKISNDIKKIKDMYEILNMMQNLLKERQYDSSFQYSIDKFAKDFASGYKDSPIYDSIVAEYQKFLLKKSVL
ncbi:glycosyltransferase family 2 protein [bacterium]|nr:glycosyltransferase family 2 protein [bacterium]